MPGSLGNSVSDDNKKKSVMLILCIPTCNIQTSTMLPGLKNLLFISCPYPVKTKRRTVHILLRLTPLGRFRSSLTQSGSRLYNCTECTQHSITTAAGRILVLIPGLGSGCQRWVMEGECVSFHTVPAECEIAKEQQE